MLRKRSFGARAIVALCLFGLLHAFRVAQAQAPDPLPSWNEGPAKARIVAFVQAVKIFPFE